MKSLPAIVVLLMFAISSFAQTSQVDSLLSRSVVYDNTVLKSQQKIDSLQSRFYEESDSLKLHCKNKLSVLDSSSASVQRKVDNLKSLQLPTEKYTSQLDSINQLRKAEVDSLNKKVADLKSKTTGKLKALNLPPELNERLTAATKNIDEFQLPVKDLNIPSLNLPENPLKSLDGFNTTIQSPLGEIGNIKGLEDVQSGMGDISKVTGDMGAYKEDLQNITKGNLNDVKVLPKALENKAGDLTGISDLQNQATGAVAPLQDITGKMQDPDAMKAEAIQKVQEVAIDHFAGKQEVLQQAMDKVAKYKQKYSNINSLSEIGKKRPNEMHGKPLIERLLPGIAFQIQKQGKDLLIDFNPYLGYRFTGRITAGAGWNQRVPFDKSRTYSKLESAIYGPRVFGEYKLSRGITPRLEIETMNSYVPPILNGVRADPSSRKWVWSYMVGIKKDYKIYKSLKGIALIMFNLYDPFHKSPYGDRVITRFGFELPMKKRHK